MKKLVLLLVVIGLIYFGVQWAGKKFDETNKTIQEADYRKERFKYGPAASGKGVDPEIRAKVDKEFEAIEAQQDKIAKQMNPYKGKIPAAASSAPTPSSPTTPAPQRSSGSDQIVSTGSGAAAMPSVGNGGSPAVSTARMRERVQQASGSSAPAAARPAASSSAPSTTRLGEGTSVASSDFASRANRMVEPTGNPNEVKVLRNVIAYNPADPSKQMGAFVPDSLLLLGDKDPASGMVHVTFTNTDGSQIQALCKAEEMGR